MSEADDPVAFPAKGRPLGSALCWLSACDQLTKRAHMDLHPSQWERVVARIGFREEHPAYAAEIEASERPKRVDEDSEPDDDPSDPS
jgi:hypothetical protein